jgi:2-iminobutanoate/2-iminopropanoate deaminase
MEYWPLVNKVFADFFGDHKPARAIVPVKELHYGFKIEADAIGVI